MFARISILAAVAAMASATKLSVNSATEAHVAAAVAASVECTEYYTLDECSWDFTARMNFRRFGYCWDGC